MIDETGFTMDAVYFNKLQSDCGSAWHHGDSKAGTFQGYDEVISVNLGTINFAANYLAVLINSNKG